jgi:hypothetical protein
MATELQIEAPRGAKVLLLTFPDDVRWDDVRGFEKILQERFALAKEQDSWPVVVMVMEGVTARWLEAE